MTNREGRLGAGRLCIANYAPGLLGAWTFSAWIFSTRGRKNFLFQKKFKNFFVKKFFSKKKLFFFKKKSFFFKKHFFLQKNVFLSKKVFFLSNDSLFSNKNFFEKKTFSNKKVFFEKNVNIFEAFHLMFVKKNRQNRERRKRSGNRKKPSSDWLEKDC